MTSRQQHAALKAVLFRTGALLLVLCVAGYFSIQWSMHRRDQEMSEELLDRARLLGEGLNFDRLRVLSGTETDLDKPEYKRISGQLTLLKHSIPGTRSIRVVTKSSQGAFVLVADSEPENSANHASPGTPYLEATEEFTQAYRDITPHILASPDKKHVWRSAVVPVRDPEISRNKHYPEIVHALIRETRTYLETHGKESLLQAIRNSSAEFADFHHYIFAYDSAQNLLAHPQFPAALGKQFHNFEDAKITSEIVRKAQDEKRGFIACSESGFPQPDTRKMHIYFEVVDDIILCAGSYADEDEANALLVVETDNNAWTDSVRKAALPGILLTISLTLCALVGGYAAYRRTVGPASWARFLEPGMAVCCGLLITAFATNLVTDNEQHLREVSFRSLASSSTGNISASLRDLRDYQLESLAQFILNSEDVTENEFTQFTGHLAKNHAVYSWIWIPSLSSESSRHPSEQRRIYLAPKDNPLVFTSNHLSTETLSAALDKSLRTGLPSSSDSFSLPLRTGETVACIAVVKPVLAGGPSRFGGHLIAIIDPGALLGPSTNNTLPLEICILEQDRHIVLGTTSAQIKNTHAPSITRPVLAFGQVFNITAYAGTLFDTLHPSHIRELTIIAGIMLTAVLSILLETMRRRRDELENLVAQRTAALVESETWHRSLFTHSPDAYLILTDEIFTDCNEAAMAMLGGTRQEILNLHPSSISPPYQPDGMLSAESATLKIEEARKYGHSRFEWLHRRLNGTGLYVEVSLSFLPIPGQNITLVTWRDLGERKKMEDTLKENERFQRKLLASIDAGILLINTETHRIEMANAAAIRLFKAEDRQIIGESCHRFICSANDSVCQLTDFFEDVEQADRMLMRYDGTMLPVLISIRRIQIQGTEKLLETFVDLSARKAAEAALRQERDLFAAGPVMTISWLPDKPWPINYVSENVIEILGYTYEEMLSNHIAYPDLIHPDDRRRAVREANAGLRSRGLSFEQSYRLLKKDGSYSWFYTFVRVLRGADSKPESIRGYMFDQSNLKQIEAKLDLQRNRLANIIEATNAGTWEWNVPADEIVINPRWANMLGYRPDELARVNLAVWKSFIHSQDLEHFENTLAEHVSSNLNSFDIEYRMHHRDGHWIWVQARGQLITRTADGRPLMMFGSHQDITIRKQAEEALLESEERYRVFFNSAADAKLILEPATGIIVDANQAATQFYRVENTPLPGISIFDLSTQSKTELQEFLVASTHSSKEHFLQQHRLANGDIREVEVYSSPIQHMGQSLIMSTVHDVTELRQLERIRADVERIVQHDLKSPLNGLINIPEIMLDDDNLNETQKELLQLVATSGRKMLSQINSALEMHKIESGTYVFDPYPCNISRLIRTNCEILLRSVTLPLDKISVQFPDTIGEDIVIDTDERLLDVILMNTLRNALEASSNNRKMLVVVAWDKSNLLIQVNNDQAVPEMIREHFFDKYTTANKKGGTGLGTYSMAMMTRAIGGDISMETSEYVGTTLTIKLPMSHQTAPV